MSINVHIPSHGIRAGARKGESLIRVLHKAGLAIEAACGGQGTCGRCVVQLLEGHCHQPPVLCLSEKQLQEGFVLACQATLEDDDLMIEIPNDTEIFRQTESFSNAVMDSPAFSSPLSPLSRKTVFLFPEHSSQDHRSDWERLLDVLQWPERNTTTSLKVLRQIPQMLHDNHQPLTITYNEQDSAFRILHLEVGDTTARHYGMACDIGTTSVALQIVDLESGSILETLSAYNDQIHCGADVISRILFARKKGHLEELSYRIIDTINGLLGAVLSMHHLKAEEVTAAVLAGNTTMMHLLLGIDPRYIREDPYQPVMKRFHEMEAGQLGIHLHPEAPLLLAPAVGSWVGGDITAGLLFTQWNRPLRGLELFVDIGTNGEMVLSGEEWRIGCACSAGPAFEGVGIRCGMRASEGAIDSVIWDDGMQRLAYRVIGGGFPRGICGSGLIELVATLFERGIIGRDGRFDESKSKGRLQHRGKQARYLLVPAMQSSSGQDIYISEQDIANLIRAKAAIFSAGALLLKNVGLSYQDLDRVHVAGGFGQSLDIEKAITIGLFPEIDPKKYTYLGNTSLAGARLALLSADHRRQLVEIATGMTYVDLSSEQAYMTEYTAALFLPHTDEKLFPKSHCRFP